MFVVGLFCAVAMSTYLPMSCEQYQGALTIQRWYRGHAGAIQANRLRKIIRSRKKRRRQAMLVMRDVTGVSRPGQADHVVTPTAYNKKVGGRGKGTWHVG